MPGSSERGAALHQPTGSPPNRRVAAAETAEAAARHQVAVQLAGLQDSDSDRCAVGRTGEVVFDGRGQGPVGRLVEGVRHLLGLA